jgi:hypothetical protein
VVVNGHETLFGNQQQWSGGICRCFDIVISETAGQHNIEVRFNEARA